MNQQPWAITTKCCWCSSEFVQLEIDHTRAWLCASEACRERQLRWKRVDIAGNLFYCPLPRQVELHEAIASQQYGAICIGGERGSSKSIALRNAIYNACESFPEFSVLFFRKELTELELNQWRFFERECPRIGADWSARKITFPKNGSEIRPAHSHQPTDFRKYIGADVDLIAIEQVEEFSQRQLSEIGASTGRSTRLEKWRGLLLVTENPGGPLSDFVNQIWVRKDLDRVKYPDYNPADYHFIEARLADNPWTDSRYEQKLAILSPARRAMMRHGRRDVFERQYFPDFLRDSHVIELDTRGAKWCASLQWGFNAMGHALIWAILPSRHLYIRGCVRLEQLHEESAVATMDAYAKTIGLRRMPITYGAPSIFAKRDDADRVIGQTVAESLQYAGLTLAEGDGDLENGWARCHAILRNDPQGIPWLRIHPSCEDLISALSTAMSDEADADLVDKQSPMLSALHALRIGAMSRPAPDHAKPQPITYPPGTAGYMLREAMKEARASV